jgi:hypothetical protein
MRNIGYLLNASDRKILDFELKNILLKINIGT